jgi:hypothetical protein
VLADPFWLRKIITDSHIRAHVHTDIPDNRLQKLKIYISERILDSYNSWIARHRQLDSVRNNALHY